MRDASVSVVALARAGRVTELPNIGETLEEKLLALDETGDIPAAVKLARARAAGARRGHAAPRLRPQARPPALRRDRSRLARRAARGGRGRGKIRGLRGFGARGEENLLRILAEHDQSGPATRIVLSRAIAVADQVVGALRDNPAADRVEAAGSLRRWAETVKDIDVIATATDPAAMARTLGELEIVESVASSGDAGARVTTHNGVKVDLKVVKPDQFGNVLQHFTGSKAHNVALRESAVRRGLHVSEYGILDDATGETLRCAREEEVYERLGLPCIPPELREGRGASWRRRRPAGPACRTWSSSATCAGDLHCHTTASDGTATAEEMALAARELGMEYLAVTTTRRRTASATTSAPTTCAR